MGEVEHAVGEDFGGWFFGGLGGVEGGRGGGVGERGFEVEVGVELGKHIIIFQHHRHRRLTHLSSHSLRNKNSLNRRYYLFSSLRHRPFLSPLPLPTQLIVVILTLKIGNSRVNCRRVKTAFRPFHEGLKMDVLGEDAH